MSAPAAPGKTGDAKASFVAVPAQLPELVKDGAVSRDAAWLYVILLSYVNRSARTARVWPARKSLATAMGLRAPRAVDRYLAELERAELIVIERRKRPDGVNETSVYVLRLLWDGGSAPQNTTPRPAETSVVAAQGVVPASAPGVVPASAPGVVLHSAHDLEEVDPEEIHPSPRPRFAPIAELGASPDEERRIIAEVQRLAPRPIVSMGGYLNTLHRDGKLAPILAALRAPQRDQAAADWRRRLRDLPRCPHEMNGGTQRHPATGRMACPHCQREQGGTSAPVVALDTRRTAKAG
jgi:hypothetical protein